MGRLAVPPWFHEWLIDEEQEPPPPHLQHNVSTSLESFWGVHKVNPVSGDGRLVELATVGRRRRPVLVLCCIAQVSLSERGGGG